MAKSIPKELITQPPRYEFELRTIIYSTKDCIFKDEVYLFISIIDHPM
jgi:hypothetical protein